jgi:Mn-dependent DtxR family transcriptional regulator
VQGATAPIGVLAVATARVTVIGTLSESVESPRSRDDQPAEETRRQLLSVPGGQPCVELSPASARYLLTLFDLEREGVQPRQSEIARRVGVSAPTAHEMIQRLREVGLVEKDAIRLTQAGTSAALVVRSRLRAAMRLAQEVLALDGEAAREAAEHLAVSAPRTLGRGLVTWDAKRDLKRR